MLVLLLDLRILMSLFDGDIQEVVFIFCYVALKSFPI